MTDTRAEPMRQAASETFTNANPIDRRVNLMDATPIY